MLFAMDTHQQDALAEVESLRQILAELRAQGAPLRIDGQPGHDLPPTVDANMATIAEKLDHLAERLRHREADEAGREDDWFLKMSEMLPEGVFRLDPEMRLMFANDAMLDMFGLSPADVEAGIRVSDYLEPGDVGRATEVIDRVIRGKRPEPGIYRARRKDGSSFVLEVLSTPTRDAAGNGTGLWGVARDVTAEKGAVEALRKAEAEKVAILGGLGDLIVELIDPNMRITWSNASYSDRYGMEGSLDGRPCHEIVSGRSEPCPGCTVVEALKRSEFVEGEVTDSRGRTWLSRSNPVLGEGGEPVGVVQVVFDVTERRESERAAKLGEARYRALVEGIDLGVNLIDAEFNIVTANPSKAHSRRVVSSDPAGKKCYQVFDSYESPCPGCPGELAMATGRGQESHRRSPLADGTVLDFRVQAFPVSSPDGGMAGFIEVTEDITERIGDERLAAIKSDLRAFLTASNGLRDAMDLVIDSALRMEGVDSGCVYVATKGTGDFDLVVSRGLSEGFLRAGASRATELDHGVHSISHSDIVESSDQISLEEGLRSLALTAMMHEGRSMAMLVLASHVVDEIPALTRAALEDIVPQVAGAIARIKAEYARKKPSTRSSGSLPMPPLPSTSSTARGASYRGTSLRPGCLAGRSRRSWGSICRSFPGKSGANT